MGAPRHALGAVNEVPDLAFDHNDIVDYARERSSVVCAAALSGLTCSPRSSPWASSKTSTRRPCAKRSTSELPKKLFKSKLLVDLEKKSDGSGYGQHKGSQLFSFNDEAYSIMTLKGYDFVF